jgi:hypothetical protein
VRFVVGVMACIGLCGVPLALADPPTAPADQAAANKAKLDQDEKTMRAAGYTPEMHNGQKVYCKREQEEDSRLGGHKVCATAEQVLQNITATQDALREALNNQHNVSGH